MSSWREADIDMMESAYQHLGIALARAQGLTWYLTIA
jgi:hypothetical protein